MAWGAGFFDASHGFDVSPHSFRWYLKSSTMSASTHPSSTLPETRQFPGNCTLEMALKAIVEVYHRYSIREGELDLLNFNDFKTLLTEQAPNFLQVCVSATGAVMCSMEGWSPQGGCGEDEVASSDAPGEMGCSPNGGLWSIGWVSVIRPHVL